MAHIDSIWVHSAQLKGDTIKVYVDLKPAGSVALSVPVPANFHKAIVDMAQKAADLHEAQMRAEILADNLEKDASDETQKGKQL